MRRRSSLLILPLVPAAQYVRMSDETQQYSIDNQKAAILEYASRHGFTVVKTYADIGKSGVVAKHRTALRELLRDVVSGDAAFKAVLVYDVSRWGDFQTMTRPLITNSFALAQAYPSTTVPSRLPTMALHRVRSLRH
jgi:hypothetical protein